MVKSMTGYGVAQKKIGTRRLTVEAKSVNHKYCEINLRLPPRFNVLEGKITELAKSFFKRGRIDIFLREDNPKEGDSFGKVDFTRLGAYYRQLKTVSKKLGIPSDIKLETLLSLPQVIVAEEEPPEKHWRGIKSLLKASFESLERMRNREGNSIRRFLLDQLKSLTRHIQLTESMVPKNIQTHKKNLEERIKKLSLSAEVDPQRLAQEVAYFVDRTDISEELDRLKHHVQHFRDLLKSQEPLGRKLDFLLQEMNREVNTLSSKAQNALISQHVVECKHALEKMREQVQNIE